MKKIIVIMALILVTALQATNSAKAYQFTGILEYDGTNFWKSLFGGKKGKPAPKPPAPTPPAPTPPTPKKAAPKLISTEALILEVLKKQLDVNKEQLEQTKKMHSSITENRNLGAIQANHSSFFLKNPQWIYDKDKKLYISSSILKSLSDVLGKEEISDSISEARKSIEGRSQYAAIIDKAVSLETFQHTEGRFSEISKLVEQINKTNDLKGITELQARIKGTLAMIQNETTKLQMVTYLRNAERALISQQKYKRNLKILNSKNTKMPTIRSIR
ncbi:type IV secretion system protein [Bartonella gliris]|uniref:type IV secretion system protein n=1 Tax=Bartonella gliris TaxID=3004109 RepID=UPI00295E93F1|nr:type IV secretion system protein [Bartonella gliris]